MAPARITNEQHSRPAPTPLFGWRRTLAALRRDPVLYLRHLHQQYGDIAAIGKQGPSPVVAVFAPQQEGGQPTSFNHVTGDARSRCNTSAWRAWHDH